MRWPACVTARSARIGSVAIVRGEQGAVTRSEGVALHRAVVRSGWGTAPQRCGLSWVARVIAQWE